MNPKPLNICLLSEPDSLHEVRAQVEHWLDRAGWSPELTGQVVLAIDEALTNAIRHGYQGRPRCRIELGLRQVWSDEGWPGVEVLVRDFGAQVDPEKICGRSLDDPQPGGLGVHIIRSVMDEVNYSCPPDGGMQLVMRKLLKPAEAIGG